MRLYHDRQTVRGGTLDARDEEECFTAEGRRVGVFLSTEVVDGPTAFVADVDDETMAAYEVTDAGSAQRSFVVPGAVAAKLGFHEA